jgi:hypothetical protein
VRTFGLLFGLIALVLLAQFVAYLFVGTGDVRISIALLASFLFCLAPSVYLLSPFRRPPGSPPRRKEREKEHEKPPE